jgi:hypothetical protein
LVDEAFADAGKYRDMLIFIWEPKMSRFPRPLPACPAGEEGLWLAKPPTLHASPSTPHDGHLRRDLDPDMEVEVEILDVTDEEANVLLLSIDPLAALARTQHELQTRLMELTPTVSPELHRLWESATTTALGDPLERHGKRGDFLLTSSLS